MMQNFCCKRVQEKLEVIKYICVDENCQNIPVFCELCKKKTHENHQQDCMLLNDIINKIQEDYDTSYTQFIQEIQVTEIMIYESIDNLQKYLKNIQIDNDKLIHNLEYANLRKNQLKCFLQAQQLIQQQIKQLKQFSNQFENKNSIILQDICLCENDINKIKQQQSKQTQNLNIKTIENLKEQQKHETKIKEQQNKRKIIFLNDDDEDTEANQDNNLEEEQNQNSYNYHLVNQVEEQSQQQQFIELFKLPCNQANSFSWNSLFNSLQSIFYQPLTQFKSFTQFQNNQEQRIHEIVNKPLQYFCNPQGKNVFASDGKIVQIYDVIPFEGVQSSFHYVMFYLASFCPQKLYEVFKTKEISSNGQYEFVVKDKTHDDVILQVNDTIQNSLDKRMLLSKNNSICFILLMKAIAQNFNGYEVLTFQFNFDFLLQIFQPAFLIIPTESDDFCEQMRMEIDAQSLILFTIIDGFQLKIIQVLDLKNVNNIFNEEIQLYKLRSAYGRDFYKGEWGFQSPIWTDDMKEKLDVSNEDDGIFYMDFISFIKEPKLIFSFRINQNITAYQKFFIKKNQASYFRLEILQKDNYAIYIEDFQKIEKITKFQYLISEFQSNKLVSIHKQLSKLSITQVFEKGIYVIYIKCSTQSMQNISEGTLNIFGSYKVELSEIQKIENYKYKVFENEIKQQGQIIGNQDIVQQKVLKKIEKGWVIYQFSNKSNDNVIIEQEQQTQKNYRICKPFNVKQINQKLYSNEQLTIICKLLLKNCVLPNFIISRVHSGQ